MYRKLKQLAMAEQVQYLTKKLVQIPSINATTGEITLADYLYKIISSFPYFQKHPQALWMQEIDEDLLERKNVFALLRGGDGKEKKTIIYHAHIDTVGIDDFGALRHEAFDPDSLQAFFKTYTYDSDVQRDAISGDWLFGRGSVDMQSGVAVHLVNLLYFSAHLEDLPGNLLVLFNPDEESEHIGIKSAIFEVDRLKKEMDLDFIAAINDDFISPQFEGDETRYIYTGAAGKILPSFYIYGREAHVGDTLEGIDPNLIAAELTRRIHNNVSLSEQLEDEVALPPTCLFQRDNKSAYTVQTATSSYLYFNYFLYRDSAKDVMNKLLKITSEACLSIKDYLSEQYEIHIKRTGLPRKSLTWDVEVMSLEQYTSHLIDLGIDVEQVCHTVAEQHRGEDLRHISFKMVEVLNGLDPNKKPRIIIFFAPPYLPHNFLKEETEREQIIAQSLTNILKKTAEESSETFAVKKFFPYLADGSYFSIHETDEELKSLINNVPSLGSLYHLPVEKIRELDIPSINIGVYGKDGHKWTERVYKPYSFGILPKLIRETTVELLQNVP